MNSQTTMKEIVLSVGRKHPKLVAKLQRDRDWLWISGDYKDFPEIRETLKDLGFRFSRKGHEVDGLGTCNWYHSCGTISASKRRKPQHQVKTTVQPAAPSTDTAAPELFAQDVESEFAAMFPGV